MHLIYLQIHNNISEIYRSDDDSVGHRAETFYQGIYLIYRTENFTIYFDTINSFDL